MSWLSVRVSGSGARRGDGRAVRVGRAGRARGRRRARDALSSRVRHRGTWRTLFATPIRGADMTVGRAFRHRLVGGVEESAHDAGRRRASHRAAVARRRSRSDRAPSSSIRAWRSARASIATTRGVVGSCNVFRSGRASRRPRRRERGARHRGGEARCANGDGRRARSRRDRQRERERRAERRRGHACTSWKATRCCCCRSSRRCDVIIANIVSSVHRRSAAGHGAAR